MAARVPKRRLTGLSDWRCAQGSLVPKVPLYEGDVLYLVQSQTSALVLVADAQLPYQNVGSGSITDLVSASFAVPQCGEIG